MAQATVRDTQALPAGTARSIGVAAAFVVIVLAAHADTIAGLVQRWTIQQEYSHGFFIPLISAWLLWTRRHALARTLGAPSWTGVAVVAVSGALHLLGDLIKTEMIADVGLVVGLFGAALCIGGWAMLRVAFIPIAFLGFMIPLPYAISSPLTLELQLLSSELGVAFIRLCDIPVYLQGNVIDLGAYKLGIVEACSGLRYLIPFLSLGFLAAYLYRGPLWQQVIIFLAVIPITIAMNSIRIGMIGVISQFVGISYADGFLHYFEGWVVFLICIGLLYAVTVVLAAITGRGRANLVLALPSVWMPASAGRPAGALIPGPIVAAVVLFTATAVFAETVIDRAMLIPERARFSGLVYELAEWKPVVRPLSSATEQVLGADDYLIADLQIGPEARVNLYTAYIETQRDDRTWHSPQQCLPGGGWVISQLKRVAIVIEGAGATFNVNRVIIERGRSRQLLYYWYQQRGRTIASEWTVKYYLIKDAFTRARMDGALVRLVTPLIDGEDPNVGDERLQTVMARLEPLLGKYIPE